MTKTQTIMCIIYWDKHEIKKIYRFGLRWHPHTPKINVVCLYDYSGSLTVKFEIFKFFEKKMKKLNFWKKIKCKFFTPAPPPMINVGHNLESRTPADQHWLWGEGFSHFLSLSQILCTWLSEFWLKNWYFVKSVQSLLVLWWGSN